MQGPTQKPEPGPTKDYWMATVTFAWLEAVPKDTESDAGPEETVCGTRTLTCSTPETKPEASP